MTLLHPFILTKPRSDVKASYARGSLLVLYFFLLFSLLEATPKVRLGADLLFEEINLELIRGKKIGLITNHTGVDSQLQLTADKLFESGKEWKLVALFGLEHGISGSSYAEESVQHGKFEAIPIYSLHGQTRRPTPEMLADIDLLIYDVQDVGCRSYTYMTSLCYIIEAAAKQRIPVIVLDRPNPINGVVIDGPMLEEKTRSFIGYINVPYCHGMTVGELAYYFNEEYQIGCKLTVIPMKGWKRTMGYQETGLTWIPTSPQMPEVDSPLFYPMTGLLGQLGVVNIGVGYTLPFKVVGAPWIDAKQFAKALNKQKLPGVTFIPFHYKPFFGMYKNEECHGVKIIVTDSKVFRPVAVDYLVMGMLKTLYPKVISQKLANLSPSQKALFHQANGTTKILEILEKEPYAAWKLIEFNSKERADFVEKRKKHLLY